MGKLSSRKGSAFEKKIAKEVLAVFPPFTGKDCYRPSRDGLPRRKPDLQFSEVLSQRLCLFHGVSCKHHRNWSLHHLMPLTKQMEEWIDQAEKTFPTSRLWLLVMQGNRTPIYALLPKPALALPYWISQMTIPADDGKGVLTPAYSVALLSDVLATLRDGMD